MTNLIELIGDFPEVRVLCLGDVMLDRFIYGRVSRISQEGPIPILLTDQSRAMLGGGANVARNVQALGGQVTMVGLVGDDDAGAELRALAATIDRLDLQLVTDRGRPTTVKTRYVAAGQQLLRVDAEETEEASAELAGQLLAAYDAALADADVVILSDYAKGCFTDAVLIEAISKAKAAGKPIIADPKRSDLNLYAGITLLKPNRAELTAATGLATDNDDAVERAARQLLARIDFTAILASRSEQGLSLIARDAPPLHLPAMARQVFDVSGAGDTVVATAAMGIGAGADLAAATELANHAGSLVVAKTGTAVVTPGELSTALQQGELHHPDAKVMARDDALGRVQRWRAAGLKVGFTNGCFDLLHPGHVALLEDATRYCDRLIVAINDDASVRRLKGPNRPVQDQAARALMLAAMAAVDMVVIYAEDTPIPLLESLRPDVLVKGGDYALDGVVGADLVQGYGGDVHVSRLVEGRSSTAIIEKLNADGN